MGKIRETNKESQTDETGKIISGLIWFPLVLWIPPMSGCRIPNPGNLPTDFVYKITLLLPRQTSGHINCTISYFSYPSQCMPDILDLFHTIQVLSRVRSALTLPYLYAMLHFRSILVIHVGAEARCEAFFPPFPKRGWTQGPHLSASSLYII